MVPSWPLEAQAIVMTLDINNNMTESGKFNYSLWLNQNGRGTWVSLVTTPTQPILTKVGFDM